MPHVIVHVHFDQYVAGIEHALDRIFLAAADLSDRFSWNQHAANLFFQCKGAHARLQRFFDLALESRIRVDDVPLHIGIAQLLGYRGSAFSWRRARVCCFGFCFVLHIYSKPYRFERYWIRSVTPRPRVLSTAQK